MDIPITFYSDEKGYFDRECPNPNCLYTFKVNMKDWEEKISDDEVHCPMCGHVDTSDMWWTQDQLDSAKEIAASYAISEVQKMIDKSLRKVERSTRNNKYVKLTYKPGKRITFQNNPIGQREEWENDITCEKCGTRYSVIGSAYFCPCCGYNSAVKVFNESLDCAKRMISSLFELRRFYTGLYGKDKAETMCQSLIENLIGDLVSAFQKFASCLYDKLTGTTSRVNDFQIIEKGSNMFKEATGKGYEEWLSENEIHELKILFQRRHILEHNSGMIDQKYIDKSEDHSFNVGQRVVVKENDVLTLLSIIKKLGNGLLSIEGVSDV